MPALLAALIALALAAPAGAAKAAHRPACVEIRDPSVGTYRICPPADRRR